jgi:hypothetical protein
LNFFYFDVREFISSGEDNQTVSDDGTFRKLFLDVLAGKEPDADANHDGYVTGTELGLFLQQKVTNLTNNDRRLDTVSSMPMAMTAGTSCFKLANPICRRRLLCQRRNRSVKQRRRERQSRTRRTPL